MTVLVIGANGLLGSNVLVTARELGIDPIGTYHTTEPSFDAPCYQLDIQDSNAFEALLDRYEFEIVINCAAMTDVDGCERQPKRAREINAEAPEIIARLCADRGIEFTHVSTDYVFDGTADTPYRVMDTPDPIQVYGQTKLAGEKKVQKNHPNPTIVRLSFVYGIHRSQDELDGFPAWVRSQLQKGEETPLFTDQHVTPTRAVQAAETIFDLHKDSADGLYHVACRSCVTPYEFGHRIRNLMDISSEYLREGSMTDIERDAERPMYSCLDVSSIESILGREQPTLEEDLSVIDDAFY